jgi:hypothetical protein
MGDIADAIINGDMDEVTGEWLGDGQGFPRSIHHNESHKRNRGIVPDNPEYKNMVNGIRKWLNNASHIKLPQSDQESEGWTKVVRRYGRTIEVKTFKLIIKNISKDFHVFSCWVEKTYNPKHFKNWLDWNT